MSFIDFAELSSYALVVAQVMAPVAELAVAEVLVIRPSHPHRPYLVQRHLERSDVAAIWTPDVLQILHHERHDPRPRHRRRLTLG